MSQHKHILDFEIIPVNCKEYPDAYALACSLDGKPQIALVYTDFVITKAAFTLLQNVRDFIPADQLAEILNRREVKP